MRLQNMYLFINNVFIQQHLHVEFGTKIHRKVRGWPHSDSGKNHPRRTCANSKAMYNKCKPPTVAFSYQRDPNSSVSHKVPNYTRVDLLHTPLQRTHRWDPIHISNIPSTIQQPLQTALIKLTMWIFLSLLKETLPV